LNGRPVGKIVGVGRALGSRVVTNRDLERVLDTTDEWIATRTGIRERRFVGEGEDCATLAIQASRRALEHARASGDSVDLILCATSTAPESMPSVACLVGEAIGAPGVGAFDLSAACAGFSYAASVADSMLESGAVGRVLLIGADAMKLRRCADCPSDVDVDLLDRLRGWRADQAKEQHVPAYVIFTDATLTAIAEHRPGDSAALVRIPGIGARKLDRYGEAVLGLVAESGT
jgi:3-oxoacyl-[acyl-carrier-protein] synthase III